MSNDRIIPVLLAILVLTGCSITINRDHSHDHDAPPPPTVVYEDQDPVLREIDAAASLSFENHRHERLMRISKRDDLSPAAQSHLIKTAAHNLAFENHRYDVFIALIENPAMNLAGRNSILDHLNSLSFENHRVGVLNKLDEVPVQYAQPPPAHRAAEGQAIEDQSLPSPDDR